VLMLILLEFFSILWTHKVHYKLHQNFDDGGLLSGGLMSGGLLSVHRIWRWSDNVYRIWKIRRKINVRYCLRFKRPLVELVRFLVTRSAV